MIIESLKFSFKQKKLYNSWLIESSDIDQSLKDVQEFICKNLLGENIALENHPDYHFVAKEISGATNAKDISITQIRKLQEFLNKSSAISGFKVAIIYQADLMNLNAANSCLKILEDTPKNSYIFLITLKAASILTTIRSRCFKISVRSPKYFIGNESYARFIKPIADYTDLNSRLAFINQFSGKDRELWLEFIDSILHLMNRIIKKSSGINVELTELEKKILNKLPTQNLSSLVDKFTNIKRLIYNTIDYDLDLRASCILLMSEFLL
ncbi:DNA polymerase III subunit delta' [Rickettsia endosymbiont of Halotydeus destructor]|uniref:DNA polymerase III subunit delta' n=1 Tax=Rickettsia endosymbiont of Halotydeus destructor TaxID=2996754 RepID=UPI003BAEC93C